MSRPLADLDLISEHFAPLEPGKVVRIAEMPGRLRSYDLRMTDGARHTAVGIAVSRVAICWWRWREARRCGGCSARGAGFSWVDI